MIMHHAPRILAWFLMASRADLKEVGQSGAHAFPSCPRFSHLLRGRCGLPVRDISLGLFHRCDRFCERG